MSKITRIGIAVPIDWECQSRDTAGQWPCPNGVPSICRYYNHGVSDACVFSYCKENTERHACCQYFESWLGNVAHYDSDGTNPSVTNAVAHNGETPAAPEAGMTVAQYVDTYDITTTCASNYTHLAGDWGYPNWWSEPDMSVNYINFPILRYEFGSDFGLSLYSQNGDAVLIRGGNTPSTFRPVDGSVPIPLNESVGVSPMASSRARRLKEGETFGTTNPHDLIRNEREYQVLRTAGSCHPYHGCAKKPVSETIPPVEPQSRGGGGLLPGYVANREQGRHGRMLRRGGGSFLSTMGSFTLSSGGGSNNRCGNGR
jgi:hypothetical protein